MDDRRYPLAHWTLIDQVVINHLAIPAPVKPGPGDGPSCASSRHFRSDRQRRFPTRPLTSFPVPELMTQLPGHCQTTHLQASLVGCRHDAQQRLGGFRTLLRYCMEIHERDIAVIGTIQTSALQDLSSPGRFQLCLPLRWGPCGCSVDSLK